MEVDSNIFGVILMRMPIALGVAIIFIPQMHSETLDWFAGQTRV